MIRNSKEGIKKACEKITECLEHNNSLKEGEEKIKEIKLSISKDLFFCGANEVENKIFKALKLKFWEAPFSTDTKMNEKD
jgi:hypothetical protein